MIAICRVVVLVAAAFWLLSEYPWYVRALVASGLVAMEICLALLRKRVNCRAEPATVLPALKAAWQYGFTPFEAWVLMMLRSNGHMDVKPGTRGDHAVKALVGAGLATFDAAGAGSGYRAYPS